MPNIEDDTIVMPAIIADAVVSEALHYLYQVHHIEFVEDHIRQFADALYDRAQSHYNAPSNAKFRAKCKRNAAFCRDWHYTFMRHWLAAELNQKYRSAYEKLPKSFSNGETISKYEYAKT